MEKNVTFEDFKFNTYAYHLMTEEGRRSSYSGKYEINYSSILSRLIQEAGRFCEFFASDLFIDWGGVLRWMDEAGECEEAVFLFGFRQSGVDGNSYVLSRYNGGCYRYPEKEYRSMWRLEISTNDNEQIKMILGRVF